MVPPPKPPPVLEVADPEEDRATPIRAEALRVATAPRGRVAEQFRQLRNSVQAMNPDGAPRSLMLAGAVAGEGATTAALNLALSMVEMPHLRVLVIDADLHEPGLEKALGLPRRQGLVELLRGELDLDRAVRETACERLYVMGSGRTPENPSLLLGGDHLPSLLRKLKRRFDYVLIDAPPVLEVSDATLLAAATDGAVLVVRLRETPKHLVELAANTLEGLGANLLGTCLTGSLG